MEDMEALDVSINFRDSCHVDLRGMSVVKEAQETTLSLDNFDDARTADPSEVLLNSPRSIEACLRLGILPHELLQKDISEFYQGDPELAEVNYTHFEKRRRQKLKTVKDERLRLMFETTSPSKSNHSNSHLDNADDTAFNFTLRANHSLLRQQLLYEECMKQKLRQREVRLEAQKSRDEACAAARAEAQKRKLIEDEMKLKQRQEERLKHQKDYGDLVERKQAEFAMQEEARRKIMQEKNERREAEYQMKKMKSQERRDQMAAITNQILEEKRQKFTSRLEKAQEAKKEFEIHREVQRYKRVAKMEDKEARVKEAQQRGMQIEQYKLAVALQKQLRSEETRKKFEEQREMEQQLKKQIEEQKQEQRERVYQQSKEEEQQKIASLIERQQRDLEKREELQRQKERAKALQDLERALNEEDKKDNVLRMKRILEYQKFKTLKKVEQKLSKSQAIEEQRETMMKRKKAQREEIERSKVYFTHVTPGPGDYELRSRSTSPAFKFGVSREDFNKCVYEPGGDSPGPAAYFEPVRRPRKSYTFGKAERWASKSPDLNLPTAEFDWVGS